MRIGLGSSRREIDLEPVDPDGRGEKTLVPADVFADSPGQRLHVALDGEVDVGPLGAHEQVPDRATDEIYEHLAGDLADPVDRGQRIDPLGQALRLDVDAVGCDGGLRGMLSLP